MELNLPDLEATACLGRALAEIVAAVKPPLPVFFYGDLGAGKTTLISALVRCLPGGKDAETSSPSFTLSNMYATDPPVAHYDLYRQENGATDESLLDFLDGERHVVLIEWAERLPARALPAERIACYLEAGDTGRKARLEVFGRDAGRIAAALREALHA